MTLASRSVLAARGGDEDCGQGDGFDADGSTGGVDGVGAVFSTCIAGSGCVAARGDCEASVAAAVASGAAARASAVVIGDTCGCVVDGCVV